MMWNQSINQESFTLTKKNCCCFVCGWIVEVRSTQFLIVVDGVYKSILKSHYWKFVRFKENWIRTADPCGSNSNLGLGENEKVHLK